MKTCLKGIMPEWYELEEEKGEQDATAFYLVPLDSFAQNEIKMLSLTIKQSPPELAVILGTSIINRAFKLGVKDWRNIDDGENGKLAYSTKAMSLLNSDWILEVGTRVLELSEMGHREVKNSDSPSS